MRFNARGLDGLLDGKAPGPPSKLNDAQSPSQTTSCGAYVRERQRPVRTDARLRSHYKLLALRVHARLIYSFRPTKIRGARTKLPHTLAANHS
jgi:hypothetical protein